MDLSEDLSKSLVFDEDKENEEGEPLIIETEVTMSSYVEDYYKRKAKEEREAQEMAIAEHLKGLCGFEPKEPEKLDTDELINRMHAVTKQELERMIKNT